MFKMSRIKGSKEENILMDTLTKLAIKHKTDKYGKHNYTPHYYQLFHNKSKRKKVKKVLEIGVAEGAGIRMFRDFFTNARLYGAEIDSKRCFSEERIEVLQCDQSKQADLLRLIEKTGMDIDLVIDDGSHKPEHQVFTCLQLLPVLDKGAIYVIEDVADKGIYDKLKEVLEPKGYKLEMIECSKERYDDVLIVIRK